MEHRPDKDDLLHERAGEGTRRNEHETGHFHGAPAGAWALRGDRTEADQQKDKVRHRPAPARAEHCVHLGHFGGTAIRTGRHTQHSKCRIPDGLWLPGVRRADHAA
jgi:hypothetical protein